MSDEAVTDAKLFAFDALAAARRRMSQVRDGDADTAMMAVYVLLSLAALFPDLLTDDPRC